MSFVKRQPKTVYASVISMINEKEANEIEFTLSTTFKAEHIGVVTHLVMYPL